MTSTRPNLSQIWRRLSWPDLAAIIFVILGLTVWLAERSGRAYSFAKFAGLLSAGYLAFRVISGGEIASLESAEPVDCGWAFWRWSRLLLLTLAALGDDFYSQLGGTCFTKTFTAGSAEWRTRRPALPAPRRVCRQRFPTRWKKALDAQIRIAYAKELPGQDRISCGSQKGWPGRWARRRSSPRHSSVQRQTR